MTVQETIPDVLDVLRTSATGVSDVVRDVPPKSATGTLRTAQSLSSDASNVLPVNSPIFAPVMFAPLGAANTTPATLEADAADESTLTLSFVTRPPPTSAPAHADAPIAAPVPPPPSIPGLPVVSVESVAVMTAAP